MSGVFSTLLGAAVFLGIMAAIAHAHTAVWRKLSGRYAAGGNAGPSKLETLVLIDRSGEGVPYRSYAGAVIGVTDRGLRLSLLPIPPLNMLAPPVLLPFTEMTLAPTSWGLWQEPHALHMKRAPELQVVLSREAVSWIRMHTKHPPFGWDG